MLVEKSSLLFYYTGNLIAGKKRMFRKKSDGIHNRYKDSMTVSAKTPIKYEKKRVFRILLTLLIVAISAGFIFTIRSCNCNSSVLQTNPQDKTDTLNSKTEPKPSSAQKIKPAKPPVPEKENISSTESQEPKPAKPEPKTVDLGTHVEIITH